ncbi:hypothetical protein ES705_27309 [subsurface metagenome]
MKVCIDVDDYHSFPKWDCSDVLERLISEFPDIRVTLFVTPYMKKIPLTDFPQAIDRIKEMLLHGNVEIFPHGLTHMKSIKGEFGVLPKGIAKKKIITSLRYLEKISIPYKKGFKFPWHIYNDSSLQVLEKLDYILFSNKVASSFKGRQIVWRNFGNVKKRYIQTEDYIYGKPHVPKSNEIVYYHSHAQNMRKNGIRESYKNFLQELSDLYKIDDIEYIFCSQIPDKRL